MGILQKQIMELTPLGVDTKSDPKTEPLGRLVSGDNVQAIRHAGGGVELRKRFGFSPLTTSILGGGSISKCVQGAAYGNELILCDGLELYSYSTILQKWIPKGRNQTIACDINLVSGDDITATAPSGLGTDQGIPPNIDVALFGGYRAVSSSFDASNTIGAVTNAQLRIFDAATGAPVAAIDLGGIFRVKLAVLGTSLFAVGSSFGNLVVNRVDLANPTTIAASVSYNDIDNSGSDVFDIKADVAHSVVWIAYNNSGFFLTIKSVNAALGTVHSANDVSIVPSHCINFLEWDFSNSRGYLGIGAIGGGTSTIPHVVEFNTSTAIVTNDTVLSGGIGPISQFRLIQFTGYRTGAGKIGAFFYILDTTNWRQSVTTADFDGTQYTLMFGAAPNGRAFKMGAKWYVPMAIGVDEDGSRSILMEADEGATAANGPVSIAGLIQNQDATGRPFSPGCLSSCPVSGNVAITGLPAVINRAATTAQLNDQRYGTALVSLDFSGAGLGAPVTFVGSLHVPSLAHNVYDGRNVVEAMFYADGPGFQQLVPDASGGSMTSGSTVQYCTTVSRVDTKGRLVRSAPGPISTVTLGMTDTEVGINVYLYPFTGSDPYYNEDQSIAPLSIEIWRTEDAEDVFYLCQVVKNDASGNSGSWVASLVDGTADADLIKNEILYTEAGDLDNQKAPAVRVIDVWQDRAFALTGDGSIWHSKSAFEGFGAEFSDALRFAVDDRGGKPIDIAHVDATLVLLKRESAYLVQGDGPDDKGAGPFPPPVRMSADLGIISPGARVSVDSGELIQTPKGMFTLNRGLAWESTEGVEGYLSTMTIAGGASLDSRHMAIAVTNDRVLVRDYLFGIWLSWTNSGSFLSGVAVARWLNNAAIFASDGTVLVEAPGQYFDGTNGPINERIEFGYFCPKNGRVYQMNFVGDWQATTTLSETTTFDYDPATAETKTRATTAADKTALAVVPSRGRFNALAVVLQETSITEGFRLSRIDIEWGQKQGLKKSGSAKFFR